ncbi:hypothetical protein YC2023_119051 [Brassica napus]
MLKDLSTKLFLNPLIIFNHTGLTIFSDLVFSYRTVENLQCLSIHKIDSSTYAKNLKNYNSFSQIYLFQLLFRIDSLQLDYLEVAENQSLSSEESTLDNNARTSDSGQMETEIKSSVLALALPAQWPVGKRIDQPEPSRFEGRAKEVISSVPRNFLGIS